jgi:hypothetical protein
MNTTIPPGGLAADEFAARFTTFRYTAYRLETLQSYDVPQEEDSLAAFLAGDPVRFGPSKDGWTATIANAVAAGKSMRRVHVVEEPLSDYLRYEMLSYRPNVEAGEDVRILPVRPGDRPDLPHHDYWLFDSVDLWLMEYDRDGRFEGARPVKDAARIVVHNYWRDAALHAAVPYAEYVRRLDGQRKTT